MPDARRPGRHTLPAAVPRDARPVPPAGRPGAWLAGCGLVAILLSGCGALPREPVPVAKSQLAAIPQLPDVRAWLGQADAALERDLIASFAQESPADFPPAPGGEVRYPHLALSGGGANGAFGAGFLNGWSRTGIRPVFKIVTGVSTGALMAPFAFLGSAHDDALREFYTTTRTRDIFVLGSLIRQLLAGEALADTGPLQSLLERHVDAELLRQIALAHQRGRRLYVGTVDLDALRFVVWNMGLIAASGRPEALALFRQVMLASASIPVAFPPVLFKVEVDPGGPLYDELHVDGGVGARVFVNGGLFRGSVVRERGGAGPGREDIFVIHNGQLIPVPDPIRRTLPDIALRVLDASGRAAVLNDLLRIDAYAQQEQASFSWVTIPESVPAPDSAEVFDPVTMRRLYDAGLALGSQGASVWTTRPPGRLRAP
jgi:predicted acylesterase/phospholipase RssA